MKMRWFRENSNPLYNKRERSQYPRLDKSAHLDFNTLHTRIGHDKFSELMNWLSGTKMVVEDNNTKRPAILYHYSKDWDNILSIKIQPKSDFDFEQTEMGLHFGTAGAAEQRSQDIARSGGLTYAVFVKMLQPLHMPDMGSWGITKKMIRAVQKAVKSDATMRGLPTPTKQLTEIRNTKNKTELRNILQKMGFDGIIYHNPVENRESAREYDSIIVFDPENNIRSAYTGDTIIGKSGAWL